jgi:hypothetical protein
MLRALLLLAGVVLSLSGAAWGQGPAKPVHPRLLFGLTELPQMKARLRVEPIRSMYQRLTADAEVGNWGFGPIESDYDKATAAHRCAFLYLISADDAWARKSRRYVEEIIDSSQWANAGTKGLSLYYIGKSVALSYDWCYSAPSWDAALRGKVSQKLLEQANVVYTSGGKEQNTNSASNWQGLRWSTAGLMYLATDESYPAANLDQCYSRVERYLKDNLGPAKESRGWNIEGLGYTYYPMANGVCPFAIAMLRAQPTKDLRASCNGAAWTLWTCYAALIKTRDGLWRPDFGDDNPGTTGEGSYGFAFWMCPKELHPGLKYWYDRTVGAQGDKTYDNARFGTIASILYYPVDVPEKNPMTIPIWREAFADTGGNGYFTFRNQYNDETDLVAQMYLKLRGDKGHAGPDALSFRIVGLDTLWAVGGGRYGQRTGSIDVYKRSMNTLYPGDPDGMFRTNTMSGKLVGTPLVKDNGGGHVVAAIGQNNVGVKNHKRRFVADYSRAGGANGVYVVCDTSDGPAVWQFSTLATNKIATSGNTFTIQGRSGNTLRGTVLYPTGNVTLTTGTRPRGSDAGSVKENNFVHFPSADGAFLVVLTLCGPGQTHPTPTGQGTWSPSPNGSVGIGRLQITIDGDHVGGL